MFAIAVGLPVPRICVINGAVLNAFTTGRGLSHSLIKGIINKLEKAELGGRERGWSVSPCTRNVAYRRDIHLML